LLAKEIQAAWFDGGEPPACLQPAGLKDETPSPAVTSIVETAGERGWKVPKVHDLRKTMRKFGNEVRPATVIELCQPGHAARLLAHSETRLVTSFMPCRVAIYERDGGEVVVSRMNAGLMSYLFPGEIGHVMGEATAETEAILSRVTL
ncbi:MAG: DUF302 domain-containing protein, partial [Gammaproteobacteria bacterium]